MYLTLEDYNIYSIINCYLKKKGGGETTLQEITKLCCVCVLLAQS